MYYAKPNETLKEHTSAVVRAVEKITWVPEQIQAKTITAARFHDVGKINRAFQNAMKQIREGGHTSQTGLRHEIYSYFLYRALASLGLIDYDPVVALAIITHHKKLGEIKDIIDSAGATLVLGIDFDKNLETFLRNYYGFDVKINDLKEAYLDEVESLDPMTLIREYKRADKEEFILVKGALQQADHIASAYTSKNDAPITPFTRKPVFSFELYDFQRRAAASKSKILIIEAPTGSGKTEAALLAAGNKQRIIYTINTKASINAMVERLKKYYGSGNVSYDYSNLRYYLFHRLISEGIEFSEAWELAKALASTYKKAITPVKVTTPFQLFKVNYALKDYAMKFVEAYSSTIVFDEVHALYDDDTTYSDLIDNVVALDPRKFVIMTATMPDTIIDELTNEFGNNVEVISAYNEFNPVRHSFEVVNDYLPSCTAEKAPDDSIVICGIKMRPPVLAVFNTVSHAIEFYRNANVKRKVLLHSKFKLDDRQRKEREVIDNFDSYDLIVTTQVVEASVDVSANTLVTEIAPAPAIIQRAGRVNRRRPYDEVKHPNVYVFTGLEPDKRNPYLPYRKRQVMRTIELLEDFPHTPVKMSDERDLVKAFYDDFKKEILMGSGAVKRRDYEIIDRKTNYYENFDGVPVLLREDWERIVQITDRKKQLYELHRNIINARYTEARNAEFDSRFGVFIVDWKYSNELGVYSKESSVDEIIE